MPIRFPYFIFCLVFPFLITSVATASDPPHVSTSRGMVFVLNGAGGGTEASDAVMRAMRDCGLSLSARYFAWTHGVGHGVRDMTDVGYSREQGRCFAALVAQYRAGNPGVPIYVLAHSAGAQVALEATKYLEPNSVERIVLLAPAVSANYDLRCALCVARLGVDAFTSRRDRLYLGLGVRLVGTADGKRGVPAAGRVNFQMPMMSDATLASRLHQYTWDPSLVQLGNRGGHAGSMRPAYFQAFVMPLLTPGQVSSRARVG